MKIENLKIKQIKSILEKFGGQAEAPHGIAQRYMGKKVIIRTYSAGIWFGVLDQKSGNEVILTGARRLWSWAAKQSISLSAMATHGVYAEKCKFAPETESVWLEAIEILPVTASASTSIEEVADAKAL